MGLMHGLVQQLFVSAVKKNKKKRVVPWVLFGWEEHKFECKCALLYATAVREKWLQQFAPWAISYLQTNRGKNEPSVTAFTSEIHPTNTHGTHEWPISPNLTAFTPVTLATTERAARTDSLSWHFSGLERPTHARDVYKSNESGNALPLCYKQIFPFLATAVNGLQPKRHRAQRGEVWDQREKEQRRGTHGSHLIPLYYQSAGIWTAVWHFQRNNHYGCLFFLIYLLRCDNEKLDLRLVRVNELPFERVQMLKQDKTKPATHTLPSVTFSSGRKSCIINHFPLSCLRETRRRQNQGLFVFAG